MRVIGGRNSNNNNGAENFEKTPSLFASSSSASLDFYMDPPQTELTLDEFEVLALKRLKVHFVRTTENKKNTNSV
jgi:hypothetical protein